MRVSPSASFTCCLVVAFAVRLGIVLIRPVTITDDARVDYVPMAINLLEGRGFINGENQPDSTRGPGYALFLAAVPGWTEEYQTSTALVQVLLETATTALVFWMACDLAGPLSGLLAGLAYALQPASIYACDSVGPETLFTFLQTLTLYLFWLGLKRGRLLETFLAGGCLGTTLLVRATPQFLVIPLCGVLVWKSWLSPQNNESNTPIKSPNAGRLANTLSRVALLLAGIAIPVVPWCIRNAITFPEFFPLVANGGVNFFAGSEERFFIPPPEHHERRLERLQDLQQRGLLDEIPSSDVSPGRGDKIYYKAALLNYQRQWNEDSVALMGFLFRKFLRLWYSTQSGKSQLMVGAANSLTLLISVVGFFFLLRATQSGSGNRSDKIALLSTLFLTCLYYVAVLTALYPLARYVVGFAPLLCVFIGGIVVIPRGKPNP